MIFAQFVLHVTLLSLISFGGATTVLPALHRFLVDTHHLMDSQTFSALFALSQVSPGPNILFIALFGWQLQGVGGAVAALVAMCGPPALLALAVESRFGRHHDAAWMTLIRRSLTPLTIGLTTATGFVLARGASHSPLSIALILSTVFFSMRTRVNPVWLILAGALAGIAGLV